MDQDTSALCLQLQNLHQQSIQLRVELAALPPHDARRAPITRALAALHRSYTRLACDQATARATTFVLERSVGV